MHSLLLVKSLVVPFLVITDPIVIMCNGNHSEIKDTLVQKWCSFFNNQVLDVYTDLAEYSSSKEYRFSCFLNLKLEGSCGKVLQSMNIVALDDKTRSIDSYSVVYF